MKKKNLVWLCENSVNEFIIVRQMVTNSSSWFDATVEFMLIIFRKLYGIANSRWHLNQNQQLNKQYHLLYSPFFPTKLYVFWWLTTVYHVSNIWIDSFLLATSSFASFHLVKLKFSEFAFKFYIQHIFNTHKEKNKKKKNCIHKFTVISLYSMSCKCGFELM